MAGHLFFNQFGHCQISYCLDAFFLSRAEQDLIFRITDGVAEQRPCGIRATCQGRQNRINILHYEWCYGTKTPRRQGFCHESRTGFIFRIASGFTEQRPYGIRASVKEGRTGLIFRITNGVTEQRPCGDRASSSQESRGPRMDGTFRLALRN